MVGTDHHDRSGSLNKLDLFTEDPSRTEPAERAAFLDQVCAGNPEPRRGLEQLQAGHARSGRPLDRPPFAPGESLQTVDLATAQVAAEHRPDEGMDTLGRVDPNATTDVQTGTLTPPTDLIGEVQPDRVATVDHADADATASVS